MIGDAFRRHADELERGGRSPLYVELMRAAAADADAGGIVATIFAAEGDRPAPVPALRLLAALHHLVLSGAAPQLARHFPSVAGDAPAAGAWDAARDAIAEHEQLVRERVRRTVQTNEPGRCAALYGGLLWLSERHGLPLRLLEVGASAGLNLNADRFRYVVGGAVLGDPSSPLELHEPWIGSPVADPATAAARLKIGERAGCDSAPIDPTSREGRLALASYVWPDEPERLGHVRQAAEIAAAHPVAVQRAGAAEWLAARLAEPRPGTVTVIWQSAMNIYLDDDERAALRSAFASAGTPGGPIAWLTLERPLADPDSGGFELRCAERPEANGSGAARVLAQAGYHGPPVVWQLA